MLSLLEINNYTVVAGMYKKLWFYDSNMKMKESVTNNWVNVIIEVSREEIMLGE
jgi:hypothetical protein